MMLAAGMPWRNTRWQARACEDEEGPAHDRVNPTSGWRPGQPGLAAGFVGVLRGGSDATGRYQVWAESGGTRTHLVWPSGFVAWLDPLEVVDRDGRVVAREGDVIQVAGGAGAADPAVADAVGASRVFVIHSQPVVLGSGTSSRQPDS